MDKERKSLIAEDYKVVAYLGLWRCFLLEVEIGASVTILY